MFALRFVGLWGLGSVGDLGAWDPGCKVCGLGFRVMPLSNEHAVISETFDGIPYRS